MMCQKTTWFISTITLCLVINVGLVYLTCDHVYTSNGEHERGFFQSPNRSSTKPFRINLGKDGNLSISTFDVQTNNNSIHCVYKFVASHNERVVLTFSQFRLRGDEPECDREYMDIYVKLRPEDNLADQIKNESANGRFCTSIMPRRLVSLHNMLVLMFYSELPPPVDRRLIFAGSYEFIQPKAQAQIGPPVGQSLCTHIIRSADQREGDFQSITYPGVYIKGLKCSYKFLGKAKERVRLEFLDLDVFSGGSHCPLDSVKIHDGSDETDPIISNICGSHRSFIVYSTHENLLITFTTLQREAEVQNRGFSAYFEFNEKFVDPSFIRGHNVRHVRGSECDQRVISHRGTKGVVVSPENEHHPNAICRYFFEGLQNSVDYEKVQLRITLFDFPGPRNTNPQVTTQASVETSSGSLLPLNQTALATAGDANISIGANSSTEICPDSHLRLYTSEQKPDQKQDPNDYDYVFCSSQTDTPPVIESDAGSLLMEYNSGQLGGKFAVEYSFIMDFRIPGTQIPPGCDYIYRSESLKSGTINSPRHPSWYINDMNCSYTFFTKPDEVLLLQFGTFKMSRLNEKLSGHNEACLGEDSVEILELTLDSNESRILDQTEIGTNCGTTTPGPILSFRPLRINFRTNKQDVNYGFSATYAFHSRADLRTNEFVTNCGGQITASSRLKTGVFGSPETYRAETYEKRNHICSWNVTARPTHRIALDFTKFELEGSPSTRGCTTASVRIDTGRFSLPKELCGNLELTNASGHQFISDGEWLSLTFISTKQASGSNGFTATWTEIKRMVGT